MDFFERQEKAHRNTKLLVVYFVAGVAMLIAAIYLVCALIFTGVAFRAHKYRSAEDEVQISWWNPKLFLGVATGTLAVVAIGSIFKTLELSQGGSAVATMLNGRLVPPTTPDPNERKLLNVVEEMAIAAGVPVPQVYVMDEENGINAFAAGHSTSDAVISVTRGAIKLLTRDELQGVIGHEFSHILNGDMRLNLRLMGAIFGIVCLAIIGRILLQVRGSDSKDKNPLPLLGLALLLLGWIGFFFGRLIQAAVSRQREFLADASSVQFTRNPAGLSGALQKIGRYSFGSHIEAPQAEQVSHMFFGNGVGEPFFGLMATHPPITERIHAIDPAWEGKFPPLAPDQFETVERAAISQLEHESGTPSLLNALASIPEITGQPPEPSSMGRDPFTEIVTGAIKEKRAADRTAARFPAPPVIAANSFLAGVGAPNTAHLRYAEQIRNAIPENLKTAARDSLGASTIIYSLLLSGDESVRQKQLKGLATTVSSGAAQETAILWPRIEPIATHAKLPLVDLALPALRQLSRDQYQQFSKAIQELIEADNEIDLFEYVLQKVVLRHLDPHFNGARKPIIQYYSLKPLAQDCAVLLSGLARLGEEVPEKVAAAFQQGAQPLSYAAQVELALVPAEQCDLSQVDAALNRLAQAAPQIKKNLLNACAQTVAADGLIQETEAEMLRAIADTLDCPLPPFIPAQ
jgi:Zn-dependent protease with chaperone function/uncharacterized tellurite resistance protein B-like protein